ncbi:hypothetical protein DRE_03011 [Drechslerella stenobrocha 248]|uniref:Carboxylic ester hydrolase n=1 Tax=Drechslerella stenobrocha 248 TaxID=1043628 RepID=W7HUC8_9PEZI|nr:hypothetical protein DRE_03011 [Drechslerella stenobrocha 248]
MRFAILSALFALAAANPLPRSSSGCFTVSQFRNSGSPHSISASVSFSVKDAATALSASCFASLSIQPSVVTTQFPTTCNDTTVFFGVEYNPGVPGYYLTLAHVYNDNKTVDAGSVWLGSDIKRFDNPSGNPNGDYDYLNYPSDFTVGYNRHTQA